MERRLPVFGGMADGVKVDDLNLGALASHLGDKGADPIDGLGRLRDDPDAFDTRDFSDVVGVQNDAGIGEIALKAEDFDVTSFADNDGLVAIGDDFGEFAMGYFDKRAGGVSDLISGVVPVFAVAVRCSVGGDDDALGGSIGTGELTSACASGGEIGFDDGVVRQLSENGGWACFEDLLGGLDGLADAEAHASVLCDENVVAGSVDGLHFRPEPAFRVWRDDEGGEKIR